MHPAGRVEGFGQRGVETAVAVIFGEEGGFVEQQLRGIARGFDRAFAVAGVTD